MWATSRSVTGDIPSEAVKASSSQSVAPHDPSSFQVSSPTTPPFRRPQVCLSDQDLIYLACRICTFDHVLPNFWMVAILIVVSLPCPVGAWLSALEFLGVSHILTLARPRFQRMYAYLPMLSWKLPHLTLNKGKTTFFLSKRTLAMSFVIFSLSFYCILSLLIGNGCRWGINFYWTSFWYIIFKSCIEKLASWFWIWG